MNGSKIVKIRLKKPPNAPTNPLSITYDSIFVINLELQRLVSAAKVYIIAYRAVSKISAIDHES